MMKFTKSWNGADIGPPITNKLEWESNGQYPWFTFLKSPQPVTWKVRGRGIFLLEGKNKIVLMTKQEGTYECEIIATNQFNAETRATLQVRIKHGE